MLRRPPRSNRLLLLAALLAATALAAAAAALTAPLFTGMALSALAVAALLLALMLLIVRKRLARLEATNGPGLPVARCAACGRPRDATLSFCTACGAEAA